MKKEYKMSAARQQELQDELTYLKTVREKEVAELIKEARGFGDLSENSEYDEAKNEQGKLYSRIAELEDILLHVVIIDESEGASNAVSIGCTVTVVDLKTGREMPPYKVVGSQEADPMHRAISEESPFGKASWVRRRATRSASRPPSASFITVWKRSSDKARGRS